MCNNVHSNIVTVTLPTIHAWVERKQDPWNFLFLMANEIHNVI
jgi:hypothetical protein